MPDATIFAVGTLVSGILLSGLVYTFVEVRRLGREATRQQSSLPRKNIER